MIKAMQDLYDILKEIIDNECDNRQFKEYLRNKFLNKGLNARVPNMILGENIPLTECEDFDLMCFTEGSKEFLNPKYENGEEADLNLKSYFGENTITSYNLLVPEKETIPNKIIVENVTVDPMDANRFIANFVPLKKFAEWEKYKLTRYNFETQRSPVYKRLSNGKIIKLKNINEKSVSQITDLMYKNKFKPNMVTYNVLIAPGKKPKYSYNAETRVLTIEPNLNFDDVDFTVVDIIDGQHRTTGATRAVSKAERTNTTLTGSLHACFYFMKLDEAKEYIEVQSRQNAIDKEHAEALNPNDYNLFVDKIESWENAKKNILQNNIGNTYEEMDAYKKLTSKPIMVEGVKMTKIDVSDNIEKKFASEKFAEIITTLINYMKKEFYNDDIEKMKDENIFLTPNIFIGYMALAEELWRDNDYIDRLLDIGLALQDEKNKSKLKEFKLTSKNVDIVKRSIFNYFKELVISLNDAE